MALSGKKKHDYSTEEIAILECVIDYADRMIYEDKTLDPLGGLADSRGYFSGSAAPVYEQLRRNAYAKTILIETELKGKIEIRLSPTEATCPPEATYCTPHSPVGRLATICHPGFEGRSKLWGEYRVTEVRSFDRFGGPEFEANVRNFLRMGVLGDDGKDTVTDLRAYIGQKKPANKPSAPTETEQQTNVQPVAPVATPEPVIELPPAEVQITEFTIVEEADDNETELEIDGDEDWNPDAPRSSKKNISV